MALLGNYSVLNKSLGRWVGGNSTIGTSQTQARSNFNKIGAMRNFAFQDMQSTAVKLAAVPSGYYPPGAWVMPITAGALAARKRLLGEGTLTGAIAEGRNLASTLAGTSTATATLQLVVSGQVTIAGSSTTAGNIVAALSGSVSISGTSTCAGTIGAKADLQVTASGSSTCTGIPWGLGWVIADITPYTELSPQSLSDAVWSAMLSAYPDAGTAGNTLSLAGSGGVDYNTLAAAVVTALQADPKTLTVPKFMGLK